MKYQSGDLKLTKSTVPSWARVSQDKCIIKTRDWFQPCMIWHKNKICIQFSLCFKADVEDSLQDINAELSGSGDDAALSCLVSSEDEVSWSEHLRLSQLLFGFLIASGTRYKNSLLVFSFRINTQLELSGHALHSIFDFNLLQLRNRAVIALYCCQNLPLSRIALCFELNCNIFLTQESKNMKWSQKKVILNVTNSS